LLAARGWRPGSPAEEIQFLIARGQFLRAAALGPAAIPALEAALQTGSYTQRVAVVEALGQIGDPRVVKALTTALKSEDSAVCAAAVTALAGGGHQSAYDAIVAMLRHVDSHVRACAVEAVARLGHGRAVAVISPLLRDPVWEVRRAAAHALGKLKDTRAVESLAAALSDPDGDVRESAALALGNVRDRRAIGPLVKAMADANGSVRRIAASALSRIDEDWHESPEARGAVEELKSAMQGGDTDRRYTVGKLLASLGVNTPEMELPAAEQVAVSTAEKRRKLAVSLLLAALGDEDAILRQAAAQCLGTLGDPRATPALQRLLRDPHPRVRQAATAALQQLPPIEP
jgi:HEAT repeat protein